MGSNKVENMEKRSLENEELNAQKFASLKQDISKVEENVTAKLLKEIKPSLGAMKDEIQTSMSHDLRRFVQEEVALQKMREQKEAEDTADEEDDPVTEKNNKIQKKNKTTKPKKNDEESEVDPGEGTSAPRASEVLPQVQPEKRKNKKSKNKNKNQ